VLIRSKALEDRFTDDKRAFTLSGNDESTSRWTLVEFQIQPRNSVRYFLDSHECGIKARGYGKY